MQLSLERPDYTYFLRGADGRHALVNERRLEASFIITPQVLVENWSIHDIATMRMEDLAPLLALQPELIVLGSGDRQEFAPPDVQAACLSRGIGLECMTNASAARTYTVVASEGRPVAAGFVIRP